jgi:predicted DNA-binding transcriptional regulator AlpA
MPEAVLERASLDSAAVTKATVRAAKKLGIKAPTLAVILGLSDSSVYRMMKGEFYLEEGEKPFELGVLFVRLYRSLDAIVSGDENVARSWMNNQNSVLRDTPINVIQSVTGLMNVINYLDTRRARI